MKNILLPTDLSVQSLWPVHDIVKEAGDDQLVIHVVHMLSTPGSLMDLFSLKESRPYNEVPANFTEAFQMLCQKYKGKIEKMHFRFVYGNTTRFLRNFIEGNQIDVVYTLSNYEYAKPFNNSLCFVNDLCKCKVPLRQLPLHADAASEYQILSALLYSGEYAIERTIAKATKTTISYS